MIQDLNIAVLVVNRNFQPVHVTSARRAFCLMFRGSAHAMDESGETYDLAAWRRLNPRQGDDIAPTISCILRVPRVLRLVHYDRVPRVVLALSPKNIMRRDGYQCQYCGARPGTQGLNIDHVFPRSRGGKNTWENLVAACQPCNRRKGGRTPEECGMRLMRVPTRPRNIDVCQILLGDVALYKEWEPFLQAS